MDSHLNGSQPKRHQPTLQHWADRVEVFDAEDNRAVEISEDIACRQLLSFPLMLQALEAALPVMRTAILPENFDGKCAQALILVRDALAQARGEC